MIYRNEYGNVIDSRDNKHKVNTAIEPIIIYNDMVQ